MGFCGMDGPAFRDSVKDRGLVDRSMGDFSISNWHPVATLIDARLQLHFAYQLIGNGVSRSLLEAKKDDSHTNGEWLDEYKGCFSAEIDGKFRAGLRFDNLTLIILEGDNIHAFPLDGKTMAEGFGWLKSQLGPLGVDTAKMSLDSPYEDDFPPHPVGKGRSFSVHNPHAFEEVTHYYRNTAQLLSEITGAFEKTDPIRCWPHHFDFATIIRGDGEKQIGVGLSPGDKNYKEPYFYVTPWPIPEKYDNPALTAGGHWRTEGFTGAILRAGDIASAGSAEEQLKRVDHFFQSALRFCVDLVGMKW